MKLSPCCNAKVENSPFGWPRCSSCSRIVRERLDLGEAGFVYLASPYSHPDPQVRQARYGCALDTLRYYIVKKIWMYSPIVHCHNISDLPGDAKFWEEFNHTMIDKATALWVLRIPGWDKSLGVTEEISYAESKGLPVIPCYHPVHAPEWRVPE